jgi:hypothetical protein
MHKLTRIAAIAVLVMFAGIACGRPGVTAAQAPALGGCQILPADNVWNTPIDKLPLDSHSLEYVKNIGLDAPMHADFGSDKYGYYGIPYNIVPQGQAKVPISFDYDDQSDPGPYPIPPNPKIEGGGDRHILVIEQGVCKLYETWASSPDGQGGWEAGSGAIFDLNANTLRPRHLDFGRRGWAADLARPDALRRGGGRGDQPRAALHRAMHRRFLCLAGAPQGRAR